MAKPLFMMKDVLVYDDRTMFKKIKPTDIIKEGALCSSRLGEYSPLNSDNSVGKTPAEVSYRPKTFFNPLTNEEMCQFKNDNIPLW